MKPTQSKMGRPPLAPEKKRSALLQLRVTEAEKAEIEEAGKTRGTTATALLLEALRMVLHGGRAWARCSFEGCKKRATEKGYCHTHYVRLWQREARAAGGRNKQIST